MKQLIILLLLGLMNVAASADQLVSDLSINEVTLNIDFTGQNILLFGAIEKNSKAQQDIIIIIKGPNQAVAVHRKLNNFGIWVNGDKRELTFVPAYYAIASTRQLNKITIPTELARHGAGLAYLPVQFKDPSLLRADNQAYINALIRNKLASKLYQQDTKGVQILDGRLFRAEIAMPPGIPVGTYQARILLFENGVLTSQQINKINVGIRGIGQLLYSWAHTRPALYGIIGVLVSIFCGWGTAILFRRRA